MTEKIEDHTEEIRPGSDTENVENQHSEAGKPSKILDDSDLSNTSDSSPKSDKGDSSHNDDDSPDTFPREYVEKLRDENAKYRQRAQRSDDLAQRLHEALVTATGRLQDPSDLGFDESHLDDPEALQAAIEDLLARKPHLASRRPLGDIGQGVTNGNTGDVDLAALLRSRA